ncbi:MAG: aldo/keto reductase [Dehalococcoidales bacterium]|nr:MAG: aldo/keto reductase [Dehalococcoidales bacterium]
MNRQQPHNQTTGQVPETVISESGIPYRTLGSTGEKVSIIGLGGAHIGIQRDENDSIGIIRTAIDNGINFMDNSWDYNNGASEIRMGKALRDGYRSRVFLMTKIDGQTGKSAIEQLDESLKRLQTDTIDLLQFHEVIRMTDPERIFQPGGGMEAILKAKAAGKVRYIGFTGHKSPDIHLKMLQVAVDNSFMFDTVQMPLNIIDAHKESFQKKVLPVLIENSIGVLAMKSLCNGLIFNSGVATAVECLHYAMSLPVSVVITGCDSIPILQQALEAARSFHPMNDEQRLALLARTAELAEKGGYEPWKTGTAYDATSRNPHWLG